MAGDYLRKTSFTISAEAKRKLEELKSELRFDNYAGVTEGAIIEALLESARLADLKKRFPRRKD